MSVVKGLLIAHICLWVLFCVMHILRVYVYQVGEASLEDFLTSLTLFYFVGTGVVPMGLYIVGVFVAVQNIRVVGWNKFNLALLTLPLFPYFLSAFFPHVLGVKIT